MLWGTCKPTGVISTCTELCCRHAWHWTIQSPVGSRLKWGPGEFVPWYKRDLFLRVTKSGDSVCCSLNINTDGPFATINIAPQFPPNPQISQSCSQFCVSKKQMRHNQSHTTWNRIMLYLFLLILPFFFLSSLIYGKYSKSILTFFFTKTVMYDKKTALSSK